MKRKNLLLSFAFVIFGLGIQNIHSNPDGTPSDGRTGSPGDGGKTCYSGGCHFGVPSDATGIISTNIPTEGYTPGASYTVTVTVDGNNKKGLCVSPQKPDGTLMGSLTAGSGNQVVGTKYITHTTPKNTNPAVWTFTWVAPSAGSGAVNFYGAFANSTLTTRKSVISVNEKIASGINENSAISNLSLYPNPLTGQSFHIGFNMKVNGIVKITLIDMTGKEVSVLNESNLSSGIFEEQFQVPSLKNGVYFVRIEANNEVLNRKLLVQ
ncbi:MAG: T9SS type A sorting domain-containing protein [Bacteroidia bacterium]|nr:T9SS type A sorting domain-containing protein [Bacteroidia bacterium]MCF8426256.1 T9SS type A sorting domain-containing protein [Bacteroidia bacterium]MCF8445461.1 T9SS type A sorting domain-containing protein [Bacteroidia bacterium]